MEVVRIKNWDMSFRFSMVNEHLVINLFLCVFDRILKFDSFFDFENLVLLLILSNQQNKKILYTALTFLRGEIKKCGCLDAFIAHRITGSSNIKKS